jgi:two-component system sensor histidine kinase DevS
MMAAGPVEVRAGDRHLLANPRPRSVSDLTIGFWLSLVGGAIAALAGLWVWVLRPRAWAPIMFALSGAGLFVGCATIALNISGGLALNGTIDRAMMIANYGWGMLCSSTLVALFARFPLPLVRLRWLWLTTIVGFATSINVGFDWLPPAVDFAIAVGVIQTIAIIALLAMQAWRLRKDSEARAALLPIAIGTGISAFLFCVLTLAGQLDGGRPIVSPDMTAPLLLMIYLGLGVAIMRAKLFTLGRWALGMLLSACAIMLFLIVDAIILDMVTQQRDLAFFISAVVGITVYLPMREWMLRRAERLRDGQTRDLLQFAGDIALALTPGAADDAWRAAVTAMFEPLEASPTEFSDDHPQILESGSALYCPSPLDGSALLLRYAGGGTRMFGLPDLQTATRFAGLVRRLAESRDAYIRGVNEERGRIARDLHDDVSARLLTSLHRTDSREIHADVRGAMADIRTIVTGLSGGPQPLHALLANLRHETQTRLEAAGLSLDWPLTAAGEESRPLDYAHYRHILSIVRECVSNIIRHADASAARVWIDLIDDRLVIEMTDNGSGLIGSASHGNGLSNATRRAHSLGGTFEIRASVAGTMARLDMPLTSASKLESA